MHQYIDTHKNENMIIQYINDNFSSDITNIGLAEKFCYHPVHLNRIIHRLTGMPAHQYILKLRINKALHLIQNTNVPINLISNQVGYCNPQYFSRLIKQKTGYSPNYFRKLKGYKCDFINWTPSVCSCFHFRQETYKKDVKDFFWRS